ncbi:Atg5 protein [Saccharomycopsis crataegensis]|uniref:Autophagy protein 5 n=1 Tax=Saccharomycopsis crataegensis TaxID=43959 RepID=A0AAV5QR84_9ASCO|nr:Atg5 protein [Saccharomycopsis crataegensis]
MTETVRSMIWKGSLTVEVSLIASETVQSIVPKLYIKVLRNGYFPMYYEQMIQFFQSYCESEIQFKNVWLEYEEVPLKWNYTIGMLYDYVMGLDGSNHSLWKLSVHVSDYPQDYLLPLQSLDTLKSYWMNSIKESCFITYNSAKKIMNLSREESNNLWDFARAGNYEGFKKIYYKKIVPQSSAEVRRVPVKVYLPYSNKNIIIREPISPRNGTGDVVTLHELLEKCLPDLFSQAPNKKDLGIAMVQGASVPTQAPLWEAFECLGTIDGFLHVVVVVDL